MQADDQRPANNGRGEYDAGVRAPGTDDAPEREWQANTGRKGSESGDVRSTLAQNRMSERRRHAQAVIPPGVQAPDANADVDDVVRNEKGADDGPRTAAESEDGERDERAERHPARPDQSVADAAKRTGERLTEPLDLFGRLLIELDTRECSH